jgi:hypothetical protein
VRLEITGDVFHWRGPSPYHYVRVGEEAADAIAEIAPQVSYGWGCIPVTASIGATTWTTSLFPKDGGYLVPVKDAIRRAEEVELGDVVEIGLEIDVD